MIKLRPFEARDAETILSWIGDEATFCRWSADKYDKYPITAEDMIAKYAALAAVGDFHALTALEDEGYSRPHTTDDEGDSYPPTELENGSDSRAPTALERDRAVGHLIMRTTDKENTVVRFGFIIVDSARRGAGLGRRMLEAAIAHARSAFGAKRITIGVFEDNESARRCYDSVGFRETLCGEPKYCLVLGKPIRVIELELSLPERG